MLTKHLENQSAPPAWKPGLKGRSARIVMTNEARALRELRLMHGLSMRKAGELIGVSDSYISHIENGRADVPCGQYLERFLQVYGGIKAKSFYERARNFKEKLSPRDELIELIPRLSDEKVRLLLGLIRSI